MKKLLRSKVAIFLLALGGLIALILLAAALRDFSFRPAEPFSFDLGQMPSVIVPALPGEKLALWKILLFCGLTLVIAIILFLLLDPVARKLILQRLFRFGMIMLTIWLAMSYAYQHQKLQPTPDPKLILKPGSGGTPQPVLPQYVPPQINPWLVFALSFGIALALVLFAWFIYSRRPKPERAFSLAELAGIVREAQDDLQESHKWDDAIVRCYIRMNEVVTAQRGLVRQPAATPAEFALYMERAGLPGEAVRTLTRLFEGVRYGGKTTSPAERDLAVVALRTILHTCGVSE